MEPTVRAGNTEAILGVLQALGLEAPKLAAAAGLPADAWSDPEQPLLLYTLVRLANLAEAHSGCDHVGHLIGMEIVDLGLPSYMLFNAPDLRTGLGDLIDLFPLMNEGGSMSLDESGEEAIVRYANIVPMLTGAHHLVDCVLAQLQSVLLRYCGSKFSASEIRFPRRPPADLKPYVGHFGRAKLVFNSDDAAFVFPSSHLDHRNEKADPGVYRFLAASQLRANSKSESLLERIGRALRFMITDGDVDTDALAARVGLDRRTLLRKLRQEGVNLPALVADARFEAARQLLVNTDLPIGKIAHSLGYADASAMSRAFTRRSGEPPKAFRKNNGRLEDAPSRRPR